MSAAVAGLGNPVPPHLPKGPDVSQISATIKAAIQKAKVAVQAAWKSNPVRVRTVAAAIVVFTAAKLGVIVPEANVLQALALTLPILLGGESAQGKVTPTT